MSDLTCVSKKLKNVSCVRVIQKQPLKAADARSHEDKERADYSPGPEYSRDE